MGRGERSFEVEEVQVSSWVQYFLGLLYALVQDPDLFSYSLHSQTVLYQVLPGDVVGVLERWYLEYSFKFEFMQFSL